MTVAEKLTVVAQNVPKVYDAGKQAEYDTFWDDCQRNGERTDYSYGFAGKGWTNTTFKPKYDIKPTLADYLFYNTPIIGDLVELLAQLGIALDFSKCERFSWLVYGSSITRLGIVDMSAVTSSTASFIGNVFRQSGENNAKLVTIDKLIMPSHGILLSTAFQACAALQNITVEGTIKQTFTISACPLTVESMKSIISCLYDYATNDPENAYTYSVKFSSDCWEALEADSTAPDGNTWAHYVSTLGWNI